MGRHGGGLSGLIGRAGRLERLRRAFAANLPEGLAGRCELTNIRGDTAVVSCVSAAWSSRLRYMERQLVAQLTQLGGAGVRRLHVKVRPFSPPPPKAPPPGHLPRLSRENAQLLESAARGVEDSDLAEALRRLARRAGD